MKTLQVGGRTIGGTAPTFVIAEIGINHDGDVETARRLIDAAADAGADAVKFQTYVTEKRVPRDSPVFDVLKRCELSHEDQRALKRHADGRGVLWFSTPFDVESVAFLVELGVPMMKVASFDIVNLALLRRVAAAGLPVVLSRGMADGEEIDRAVGALRDAGCPFALLHCISAYPTPPDQANLNVIRALDDAYDCPVGFSDHTLGIDVPVYAVAAGAKIIEKHFTHDRDAPGPDHALSADPAQLADMVHRIRGVEAMLGSPEFTTVEAERATLAFRRPNA